MAQRPRDRQEHLARIRASTRGRSHPCCRDPARPTPPPRAGRGRSPAREEPENQTARVPAPGGAPLRRGAGGGPSRGNRRAGTRAVSFQLRAGPGRARPQRGATSGPPREGPLPSEVKRPQGPEVAGAVRAFPLRGALHRHSPRPPSGREMLGPRASRWLSGAGEVLREPGGKPFGNIT